MAPPNGWPIWSINQASHADFVIIAGSMGWFRIFQKEITPTDTGLGAAAEAECIATRMYKATGNTFAVMTYFDRAVDLVNLPVFFEKCSRLDATKDEHITKIVGWAKGTAPISESEPPLPRITSAPTDVIEWPEKVEELKWPLADHDDARLAFAELVTRRATFKLLAIKGHSETGKSHLTEQFFNNARRRVKSCRCARFDFKGTDQIDETLATFVHHLGVPLPPTAASLSERFRHILQSLGQNPQPSLLIFDTYEDAGDADRWIRESLLNSLLQHEWLRVVIAGQEVPPCHGRLWEDDTKVLTLAPPEPVHWHAYAQANRRTFDLSFVETAHAAVNGKASILAQICGPNT